MTSLAPIADPSVRLTDRAARRVAEILAAEPDGAALRIGVSGGGCSGFQYTFDISANRIPDDLELGSPRARVLIDPISLAYLQGAEIDYVDDLMGQSFRIENPNAVASCGCGTSFSV